MASNQDSIAPTHVDPWSSHNCGKVKAGSM
jgi:hypothetical protein